MSGGRDGRDRNPQPPPPALDAGGDPVAYMLAVMEDGEEIGRAHV